MKKWVPAFQLLGIGFYIAACIAGGILTGWWLGDKKPLWIITGLVIGLVLAFYGVYKMIKPLMNNKDDKNDKENG
jgi:F0F1-type ATP synthase assembly protein I